VRADIGLDVAGVQAAEQLSRIDPWVHEIMKHQRHGFYCGSPEDEMPIEQFRRSRVFHDFYQKHGFEWAASAIVFSEEGAMPGLTLGRARGEPPFSASDKALLRELVPHLGRAFRIQHEYSSLRERNEAGQHALDLMGAATLTLDAVGRILSINRRAHSLIADGAVLHIEDRRLRATTRQQQRALDNCLLKACACGAGKSSDPGDGALVLESPQGRTIYLSVLPYHSTSTPLDARAAALLFLTTPEEQGQGEHRLWHKMFSLSPAECRVAEMMKQGLEANEISDAIRIKVDTVRYYQKSIYRKTGARGQGPLLRLLTRLPSSRL
jgi:DNA-binding CsgD family transcriptional regulator